MKSEDALLAAWQRTLKKNPDAPALFNTQGAVTKTFGDIENDAADFESKLSAFAAGDVVAIQIGNHPDWPSVFLACLRRQLVVLPLEQSISDQECEAALKVCGAKAVVAAVVTGGSSLEILPQVLPPETTATTTRREANPPSLLKLTSGTTAAPRAVRFRSEQLLADCEQICDTMGITDADINFGVIPISHSYGFSNLLTPLLARGVPMVLSQERLPRAVLDDLARTNASVFPGMPVFYQAFCEMKNLPDLPKLRLCISAGAPLTATLAKNFQAKFRRTIHSFYGSSECGGICYDREGTDFENGLVGAPMEGVNLEMVDPGGSPSQVRVRSAAVGDGYFPEPDEEKLGRGVFVPDDLLEQHDGGFRIVGRVSDVINVAGKKVNPAEVEAQILRFPGVRAAIAFGRKSARRNEDVAACVIADANVRESDLLEFCRAGLSGWQVPKRIFLVDQIPVNERGKTNRRELALRFAAS